MRYKIYVDNHYNKIKNIVPSIPVHALRKQLRENKAELDMDHLSKDEQVLVLLTFIKVNEVESGIEDVAFLNKIIRNGGFTRSCYGFESERLL